MRHRWRALAGVAALLVAAFPTSALSCSVCFWGQSNSMVAYVATAVFLSLLPLAMIGGIVLWLRRRARDGRAGEARSLGA